MTNRFVVQETQFKLLGRMVSGWHVYDKETGQRAKGTEPSEYKSVVWKLKDELNAAVEKQAKKDSKKKKK
jgi:hypothetical protein